MPANAGAEVRHEARLRAIGLELDAEPGQSYELAVMPSAVLVEGTAGYHRVFSADDLTALVAAAARQRPGGNGVP